MGETLAAIRKRLPEMSDSRFYLRTAWVLFLLLEEGSVDVELDHLVRDAELADARSAHHPREGRVS